MTAATRGASVRGRPADSDAARLELPTTGRTGTGAGRGSHPACGGRRVKMVNSTAVGGGVAEILYRIVPLMEELGVPACWEGLKGGEEFFVITKAFHNVLHGAPFEGRPEWYDLFLQVIEENRKNIALDDDFLVIHDPQPVALVRARGARITSGFGAATSICPDRTTKSGTSSTRSSRNMTRHCFPLPLSLKG